MNPEKWRKLKAVFEEAVEMDGSSRADFLERACGGDTDLKNEIEALLKQHDNDSFLEKPDMMSSRLDCMMSKYVF